MEMDLRETNNRGDKQKKNVIRHRQSGMDRLALGSILGQIRDFTNSMGMG